MGEAGDDIAATLLLLLGFEEVLSREVAEVDLVENNAPSSSFSSSSEV